MIHQLVIREVSDDFKKAFKSGLDNLNEQAPSDSSICTKIEKLKKGYQGVLEVFSSQGRFTASAFDLNPTNVAVSLFSQIYKQITSWKKQRFTSVNAY